MSRPRCARTRSPDAAIRSGFVKAAEVAGSVTTSRGGWPGAAATTASPLARCSIHSTAPFASTGPSVPAPEEPAKYGGSVSRAGTE